MDEISWEEVAKIGGYEKPQIEMTSVTKKVRRVGNWDWDLVERAARYNRPTTIALMGADRVSSTMRGVTSPSLLTPEFKKFISELEDRTGSFVRWIGTSPTTMITKIGR
jgi:adenylosuccinate synthase